MKSLKRLVTVGDLVLDLLLEVHLPVMADAHQMSPSLLLEPGGACTTLLAARNLGMDAVALGTVGADFQGHMLQEILAKAGVDTSALVIPPGSSTTTVIALSDTEKREHVFLGHYGASPPIQLTDAAARQLEGADAVFIPGYTLVEERLDPLVAGVLDFLASSAAPLYIDVGPFLGELEQSGVDRLLSAADVLILTDDEVRFVAAGENAIDACRRLLRSYPDLFIVLKRGAAGCHLLGRGLDCACAGFAVPVVDTIGAGDAFAAAYIWADLRGYSPLECGTIGNATGAASAMKAGAGRNAPTCAEVQVILDQHNTGLNLSC